SGSYAGMVGKLRPDAMAEGEIVATDGTVLDRHQGIARYTVGQAKRLGAASGQVVTRIEAETRRIVVGPRDTGDRQVRLAEPNWLIRVTGTPFRAMVKLRAREVPQPAEIDAAAGVVTLDAPALAAPGQACVIYDGTRVLGGGFIA
ncbi:MAG TPA: aminomethyltransferase beta-barrel domain-containing protein, partial [Acetobacteraceae bacterium]|nr:aminomethyltransferase beta-barrel domain-containing protein [Acetobacteraceae bacterium]